MYKLKRLKNISFIYMSIYLNIPEIKYKKNYSFPKKTNKHNTQNMVFRGWDNYLKLYKRFPSENAFSQRLKLLAFQIGSFT